MTPNPSRIIRYTKQEHIDILKCLQDSYCKPYIALKMYTNRYPERRKPTLSVIKRLVADSLRLDKKKLDPNTTSIAEINDDDTSIGAVLEDAESISSDREFATSIQVEPTSAATQPCPVELNSYAWKKSKPYSKVYDDPHDSVSAQRIENISLDETSKTDSLLAVRNTYNHESFTIESDNSLELMDHCRLITAKKSTRKQRKSLKNTKEKKGRNHTKKLWNKVRECFPDKTVTNVNSLIVCTKRLEDMCILQRDIRHMYRKDLIDLILEESRNDHPFVKCNCCISHKNKIKFPKLKSKLKILTKPKINKVDIISIPRLCETAQVSKINSSVSKIDNDSMTYKVSRSKILPETNLSYFENLKYNVTSVSSDEDEPLEILKRRKTDLSNINQTFDSGFCSDLLIVMNNVYLNDSPIDTYCITNNTVEEYQVVDKSDTNTLSKIFESCNYREILSFDCCCWLNRQSIIFKHFDKRPFSRFISRPHECIIGTCKCCCSSSSSHLMSSLDNTIKVRTDLLATNSTKLNFGLYLQAFQYQKPSKKGNVSRKKYVLNQSNTIICLALGAKENEWIEQIGVDSYGDVDFYEFDKKITRTFTERVCCGPSRIKTLLSLRRLSLNSEMFLRKSSPLLNIECYRKCELSQNVVVEMCKRKHKITKPLIEHTRRHVKQFDVAIKHKKENSSDYNIQKCIDMVLKHFELVTFSVKEDKSVVASILSLAPKKVPQTLMDYLKQLLEHLKNLVEPLDLPPQTQLYIQKNNDNSFVIVTSKCNIDVGDSTNTVVLNPPITISDDNNIQNTSEMIPENITVVENSLASQHVQNTSLHHEIMPTESLYESFSKLMYSNRSSYNNVFRSFLKVKSELSDEVDLLPKISSVFTLNKSDNGEMPVYEDLETNIPLSTINKADITLCKTVSNSPSVQSSSRMISNDDKQNHPVVHAGHNMARLCSTGTNLMLSQLLSRKKTIL